MSLDLPHPDVTQVQGPRLEPSFELTPLHSFFWAGPDRYAAVDVHGVFFDARNGDDRDSFYKQSLNDELLFSKWDGADPTVDYRRFDNRRGRSHIRFSYQWTDHQQLALIFGVDVLTEAQLAVCTDAEQIDTVRLRPGDRHLPIVIDEPLHSPTLYIIHLQKTGLEWAGNWYFRGITGYVI